MYLALLAVAAHVAIAPGHSDAAAKIARVARVQADGVPRALRHAQDDRHAQGLIRALPEPHADSGKDPERQQILAGAFYLQGAVGLTGMQQQSPAHERLVHALESLDAYLADLCLRSGHHVKAHVQKVIVRILVRQRRIDLGECVALILERRQQARPTGEHLGGAGRVAGFKPEALARGIREGSFDVDAAEMVEGPQIEADFAHGVGPVRQRGQRVAELRRVELQTVDRDVDRALVIAVALQNGRQALDVSARTRDQAERIGGY
jgi:hypothetical protein